MVGRRTLHHPALMKLVECLFLLFFFFVIKQGGWCPICGAGGGCLGWYVYNRSDQILLLSSHCSPCSFTSLVTHLALKDTTVHGGQCSPAVLLWKMRWRVIPLMMHDQSWCLVSIGGSPGMKMPSYTAQARCSRLSMSVKPTRGYLSLRVLRYLAQPHHSVQWSDVKVRIS